MRIFVTAATMMVAIGLIGCGEKEDDTAEETATEETVIFRLVRLLFQSRLHSLRTRTLRLLIQRQILLSL